MYALHAATFLDECHYTWVPTPLQQHLSVLIFVFNIFKIEFVFVDLFCVIYRDQNVFMR